MKKIKNLSCFYFLIFLPLGAHAFERGGARHDLSVSAGFASPSSSTAIFQNPAGLLWNYRTSVDLAASSSSSSFQSPTLAGGIFSGNGSLGGGLLLKHSTATSGTNLIDGGFAINLGPSAFGLGATINPSTSTLSLNAGALIASSNSFRLGATVNSLTSSDREFGIGLSYDNTSSLALVTDATLNSSFGSLCLMPGILFRGSSASFTVAYGFSANSSNASTREISDGFTAGLAYQFASEMHLSSYYKQINEFYVELSIGL